MRLAMAEAAANNASYLSWPTWPENQRQRMIAAVRPQADLLRQNEERLNDAPFRADVVLYSPFHLWVKTDQCATSAVAATLTKENIQYSVVGDDELQQFAKQEVRPALVIESRSVLPPTDDSIIVAFEKQGPGIVAADQPDWLQQVRRKIAKPSVSVTGAPNVRAVVHDQNGRTIVHLYNLNVQRLSSFEDKVTPATEVGLAIRTAGPVGSVSIRTADPDGTSGPLKFEVVPEEGKSLISTKIPRLDVSAILLIEP
jgi:hypothetical protein